jgi:hypothetical protein
MPQIAEMNEKEGHEQPFKKSQAGPVSLQQVSFCQTMAARKRNCPVSGAVLNLKI